MNQPSKSTHMKHILLLTLSISLYFPISAQNDFIQIETNKALCLLSFLETASNQRSVSQSFRNYIQENLGADEQFSELVQAYGQLNLEYSFKREEFPETRHPYRNTKDLLWIAASNATSISDLGERTMGYFSHKTHVSLVNILTRIEPYYDELIWKKEQANITRIERQLSGYKTQIADLYLKISQFYGTSWDASIPFKIMLYPIPLERGGTTAIPKGNALICSFLSHREDEYKGTLGIIIHEMCHILFDEQPIPFQRKIDQWFQQTPSEFSKLTYSYLDEGLATVLGNGWSYETIHGTEDTTDWYNNTYINGFAKALYPLTKSYMAVGKQMDSSYVAQAIDIFTQTFPKAIHETSILMNEIRLFANSEEEADLNFISQQIRAHFRVRSMWFATPAYEEKSLQSWKTPQVTKVFIVEKDHAKTLKLLDEKFADLEIQTPLNSLDVFKDENTSSYILILNLENLQYLEKGFKQLARLDYLESHQNHPIE